jgi:hypothetical protein
MTAVMVIGAAGAVREFIVKVVQEKGGGRLETGGWVQIPPPRGLGSGTLLSYV